MSKRTWIIFAVVIAVMFGGIIYQSAKNRIDVSNVDTTKPGEASEQSGNIGPHVFGAADSKVVLVEYGDFQCPGCGSAYAPIKTVTEKYKDDMAFVFRNFPLTTIHPNAKAASAAAESAGLLGKYWQMHGLLYQNQSTWVNASATDRNQLFSDMAVQIGLDRQKFLDTLTNESERINQKIAYDQALGKKDGVSSTPSLFLNGKPVDQYVKDGKIVSEGTEGANPVWSDVEAFDALIIQPALKDAGISTEESK